MAYHRATWAEWLTAPRDFLHGFLGGLLGPLLALAGSTGLLFLLTRQLPAIKEVTRTDGDRQKALVLASLPEARASWARCWGDLHAALLELRVHHGSHSR
jgi:hypothetical protein